MWKMALAGAAVGSLLLVFASVRDRKPEGAKESAFNTVVWEDAVLKKSDRLVSADPKPVATEHIIFPRAVKPQVIMAEPEVKSHRRAEPHRRAMRQSESNICTRHGMQKVITHGGRSWRCRKR